MCGGRVPGLGDLDAGEPSGDLDLGLGGAQVPFGPVGGPTQILPSLTDTDVILERRDEENLVLTRAERFEPVIDRPAEGAA
jgi:hypothetical protein